jgi:hypothetical protein
MTISNTATTAMMVPIAYAVLQSLKEEEVLEPGEEEDGEAGKGEEDEEEEEEERNQVKADETAKAEKVGKWGTRRRQGVG